MMMARTQVPKTEAIMAIVSRRGLNLSLLDSDTPLFITRQRPIEYLGKVITCLKEIYITKYLFFDSPMTSKTSHTTTTPLPS